MSLFSPLFSHFFYFIFPGFPSALHTHYEYLRIDKGFYKVAALTYSVVTAIVFSQCVCIHHLLINNGLCENKTSYFLCVKPFKVPTIFLETSFLFTSKNYHLFFSLFSLYLYVVLPISMWFLLICTVCTYLQSESLNSSTCTLLP